MLTRRSVGLVDMNALPSLAYPSRCHLSALVLAVGLLLPGYSYYHCAMSAAQELESDVETVFPGTKRRKVGKVKATRDVTSEDALPSSETPP